MDWKYSREPWRPARSSFMDIGDSRFCVKIHLWKNMEENGRPKFSGGFWGVDFSWTSGEDPRSIGALLAALSPQIALNCTKKLPREPRMLPKPHHRFANFEIAFSRLIPLRRCAGDPWVITTALEGLQERRLGSCGKPFICLLRDYSELVRLR